MQSENPDLNNYHGSDERREFVSKLEVLIEELLEENSSEIGMPALDNNVFQNLRLKQSRIEITQHFPSEFLPKYSIKQGLGKDDFRQYDIYENGWVDYFWQKGEDTGAGKAANTQISELYGILAGLRMNKKISDGSEEESIQDQQIHPETPKQGDENLISVENWSEFRKQGWDWLTNQPVSNAHMTVHDLLKKYDPEDVATGPSYNLDKESPTGEEKDQLGVYMRRSKKKSVSS